MPQPVGFLSIRSIFRVSCCAAAMTFLAACQTVPTDLDVDGLAAVSTAQAQLASVRPPIIPKGNLVLIEPIQASKTTIIENGAPVEKYWATLTEQQRKDALPLTETIIQIEQRTSSGGITHPIGSIAVNKGDYHISFMFMRYANVPCIPSNPAAGVARVGVGLEAGMNLRSHKNKLNVGLVPLIIAAEDNKVSGNMVIRTVGVTPKTSVLAGYLGNTPQLTPEALARAMESLAVIRAVWEDNQTLTTPHYLAVSEATPGSCTGVVPPNSQTIGRTKTVAGTS